MPCVPIAGKQMGVFVVPQIGAGVWVEFEQGDPDYPIWIGGFWGIGRGGAGAGAGAAPPASPSIVLQTALQNTHRDQRPARADRRDHAEEHDRRDADRDQRHRHLHSERQGRDRS